MDRQEQICVVNLAFVLWKLLAHHQRTNSHPDIKEMRKTCKCFVELHVFLAPFPIVDIICIISSM